jgi:hypothetical protein
MKNLSLKPKFILVVIIFITGLSNSYSQEFLKGYYINQTGDTIRGLIKYYDTEVIPDNLIFKKDSVSEEISLNPYQVKSYCLNNRNFDSYKISVCESEKNITDDLSNSETKTGIFFIERLTQGEPKLYYYLGKERVKHFFIKSNKDTVLNELKIIYSYNKNEENGANTETVLPKYRGILKYYFNAYPELNSDIENLPYDKNSFIKLFVKYYKLTNQVVNVSKNREKVKFKWGLLGGISISSLKCSGGEGWEFLTSQSFKESVTPFGGISIIIQLPRNNRRWSIQNDFLLQSFKFTGNYTYVSTSAYSSSSSEFTIKATSLKMLNSVKFNVINEKLIKYSINGGLVTSYALNVDNDMVTKTVSGSNTYTSKEKTIEKFKKFNVYYSLGMSVTYKYLELKWGYLIGCNFSDALSLNAKLNSHCISLGYNF